jgi:hypothetical protein
MSTEKMKVSVVSTGNAIVDKRTPCNLRPLTLQGLLDFIEVSVRDERVRGEVKKMAKNYPAQALWAFRKNIRLHIEKAQKIIALAPVNKGELGDEREEKGSKDLNSIRDFGNDEFN